TPFMALVSHGGTGDTCLEGSGASAASAVRRSSSSTHSPSSAMPERRRRRRRAARCRRRRARARANAAACATAAAWRRGPAGAVPCSAATLRAMAALVRGSRICAGVSVCASRNSWRRAGGPGGRVLSTAAEEAGAHTPEEQQRLARHKVLLT
ncbi:hypothetical protein JKP88DRAFT_231272, partial [Tribonema minus]